MNAETIYQSICYKNNKNYYFRSKIHFVNHKNYILFKKEIKKTDKKRMCPITICETSTHFLIKKKKKKKSKVHK